MNCRSDVDSCGMWGVENCETDAGNFFSFAARSLTSRQLHRASSSTIVRRAAPIHTATGTKASHNSRRSTVDLRSRSGHGVYLFVRWAALRAAQSHRSICTPSSESHPGASLHARCDLAHELGASHAISAAHHMMLLCLLNGILPIRT
jgi:hypothetical protein